MDLATTTIKSKTSEETILTAKSTAETEVPASETTVKMPTETSSEKQTSTETLLTSTDHESSLKVESTDSISIETESSYTDTSLTTKEKIAAETSTISHLSSSTGTSEISTLFSTTMSPTTDTEMPSSSHMLSDSTMEMKMDNQSTSFPYDTELTSEQAKSSKPLTSPSPDLTISVMETTEKKKEPSTPFDFDTSSSGCIHNNRMFQSAEQIPRSDPCEFCFCFRGDILCLHQTCPPPVPDCYKADIYGYCCPRYDCPVPVGSKNFTASPVVSERWKRNVRSTVEIKGCMYRNMFYKTGQIIKQASGPCMDCKCQEPGRIVCQPKDCKTEAPLLLKMNQPYFKN